MKLIRLEGEERATFLDAVRAYALVRDIRGGRYISGSVIALARTVVRVPAGDQEDLRCSELAYYAKALVDYEWGKEERPEWLP